MRTALAWACGIVAALASGFLYSWLTGAAGVPMFEGDQRLVGATYHAELLPAVVVGCWAGLAAFNGQWGGPLTAIGRVSLVAWLAAAVVLAALAVPFPCGQRMCFDAPTGGGCFSCMLICVGVAGGKRIHRPAATR